MTVHDYKVNKQAIRDLSEGKQTDAVKEFLKRYEIRPRENKKEQSVKPKEKTETMADKETQTAGTPATERSTAGGTATAAAQAQQAAQESQDRVTGIMRTWSTGRSWKGRNLKGFAGTAGDSLIPC